MGDTMAERKAEELDLDYVILTALLAGSLTAIATAATLVARPMLIDMGKKLPLPALYPAPPPPEGAR